jgi:hypothetical protein
VAEKTRHPTPTPASVQETPYAYILVRIDIPLVDQMVQAAHAVMEAAWAFPRPACPTHLALLAVPDEQTLSLAAGRARERGIALVMFHETDGDMGYTAFCTAPLTGKARNAFRRYPLWRPSQEA